MPGPISRRSRTDGICPIQAIGMMARHQTADLSPYRDQQRMANPSAVGRRLYDRRWWICLLLVAAEAVVVLGLVRWGTHSILGGDGPEYQRYATNLVNHFAYSNAAGPPFYESVFRTPGYPFFLALFQLIVPGSLLAVRIAQFALLALTAVMLCRVALFVTTPGRALAAGVMCATFLPLIEFAVLHLTEILATFLTVAVVLLVFLAMDQRKDRFTLGAYAMVGIATGLLSLVRPEAGLVVVPIAIGLFLADRSGARSVRKVGVLLVGFVLVMTPWTIRNAIVADQFIPFSANSGQALYISAEQYAGRTSDHITPEEWRRLYAPGGDFAQITGHPSHAYPSGGTKVELADDDAIEAAARRTFGNLSVGQILRDMPSRVAHLWGTADWPPPGRSFTTAVHRLAVVQYGLILVLAAIGLVVSAAAIRTRIWPLLLFPIYTTLVHLVFHVEARFTLPARPFLFVFAGIALVSVAEFLGRWVSSTVVHPKRGPTVS
jgi:4-amino-4-deoxy-L-arabinose transferase-like glycosyltransferase